MKILLNAMPLQGLLTGISRYVRNLYQNIELSHDIGVSYYTGEMNFHTMPAQAEPSSWIKATERIWRFPDPVVLGLRSVHWQLYEYRLNRLMRRNQFDIYHETAFTPAALKNDVPQVFTLHDLSLLEYRHLHPRERVWFFDLYFKRRIHHATHIITVSEFIRREICEKLRVSPDRVTAIPEAADSHFYHRTSSQIEDVRKQWNLPSEYLLFVGTLEPRKNIGLIIEALSNLTTEIPLVLVGWKGWGEKEWLCEIERAGIDRQIYLLGYVDEDSLAALYSGAISLIYPSLYEGFGLPVLEAMACGCPVICSNVASLPEVAGNAAIQVDPMNVEDLMEAILRVSENQDSRQKMILEGQKQAKNFSWKRTAIETVEVFRKVKNEM